MRRVTRKNNRRLRKRDWTASASAFGARASFTYKSKRSLTAAVKQIVEQKMETPMHKVFTDSNVAMLANNIYSLNLLGNIAQGTSYSNRLGDQIHVDAIKMIIRYDYNANTTTGTGAAGTSQPVSIKYWVLKSKLNKQGASDAISAGNFSSTDIFINPTSLAAINMIPDPKLVSIVEKGTAKISPASINSGSLARPHTFVEHTLKLDKSFVYETGTNYANDYNYYFVTTAYSTGATTNVTSLCDIYFNADLIFKNCK